MKKLLTSKTPKVKLEESEINFVVNDQDVKSKTIFENHAK